MNIVTSFFKSSKPSFHIVIQQNKERSQNFIFFQKLFLQNLSLHFWLNSTDYFNLYYKVKCMYTVCPCKHYK